MLEFKEMIEKFQNVVFCYDKNVEEGYVNKNDCVCFMNSDKKCESSYLREEFFKLYREMESKGLKRKDIINEIEKQFEGRESNWFKYNVVR